MCSKTISIHPSESEYKVLSPVTLPPDTGVTGMGLILYN